jgi:hypothetical protein
MERERASNRDFWSGRGAGESTEVPRRPVHPYRRRLLHVPSMPRVRRGPARRGRGRPVAAAVLLATLTFAWLGAGHPSRGTASGAMPTAPTSVDADAGAACAGLSPDRPEVRCVLDGVDLVIRLYRPGTAAAAYRRASGVDAAAHSGPPTCERGAPDERAWSEPTAPHVIVGRYRCVIENGRAAMWWTRGNRVAHAVASGRDLRSLFAWWRRNPSE